MKQRSTNFFIFLAFDGSIFRSQFLDQYIPGLGLHNSSQISAVTDNDVQLPGIYTYLPHLVGRPAGLRPSHTLSQGRHGGENLITIIEKGKCLDQ